MEAAKDFKPQLQYLREYIFNLDDGTTKERIVTTEVSGDFPVVPRKFVGALEAPLAVGQLQAQLQGGSKARDLSLVLMHCAAQAVGAALHRQSGNSAGCLRSSLKLLNLHVAEGCLPHEAPTINCM